MLAAWGVPIAAQAAIPPQQPLAFEANRGQTDARVTYLARGPGYVVFLTRREAVLRLQGKDINHVLRMDLKGAADRPAITPAAPLPGRHNYYIGDDPSRWHAGVPTYGEILYHGVYPGIDLLYHGRDGRLEYDFHVAPGADPAAIRLAFRGADRIAVTPQGDLSLDVGGAAVVHHAPVAYQMIGGTRRPVAARYVMRGGQVAFGLGHYDASRPLVIDPTLIYSSYLGGTGDDEARAVTTDSAGNIYLTGATASADFPVTNGSSLQGCLSGPCSDVFITKLNPSRVVVFSTYLGSSGDVSVESGQGIVLDGSGNIYVTGNTAYIGSGASFPETVIVDLPCTLTAGYAFVSRLDASGNLNYSTCMGGGHTSEGKGIAVDSNGYIYVTGYTTSIPTTGQASAPFPTTTNALKTSASAPDTYDGFFFVLDPTLGSQGLLYSTYLGGTNRDEGHAIALDDLGHAYITGVTFSSDFPLSANAYQSTYDDTVAPGDAFIVEINPGGAGSADLLYGSYFGGTSLDQGYGIAVPQDGTVYIAGMTSSSDLPVTFKYGPRGGGSDAFVAKFNLSAASTPAQLQYSADIGGAGNDVAYALALDANGRAQLTGYSDSTDFPAQPLVSGLSAALRGGSKTDAFITAVDNTGASLYFSGYLGGSGDDEGRGIAVGADGKTYVVGGTKSGDFITVNPQQNTNKGGATGQDAFVAVIGQSADLGVTLGGTQPAPATFKPMTYTMRVNNYGPDAASNVKATLSLSPAGFNPNHSPNDTPAAITADKSGTVCSANSDNSLFTCTVGSLLSGESDKITITDLLTAGSAMEAVATVSSDEVDPNENAKPTNNQAAWTVTASQVSQPTDPPGFGGGGSGSSSHGGGALDLFSLALLPAALRRRRRC